MSQTAPVIDPETYSRALKAELEQRLGAFSQYDDQTFGRISPREAWLAVLGLVVLPLIVVGLLA